MTALRDTDEFVRSPWRLRMDETDALAESLRGRYLDSAETGLTTKTWEPGRGARRKAVQAERRKAGKKRQEYYVELSANVRKRFKGKVEQKQLINAYMTRISREATQ